MVTSFAGQAIGFISLLLDRVESSTRAVSRLHRPNWTVSSLRAYLRFKLVIITVVAGLAVCTLGQLFSTFLESVESQRASDRSFGTFRAVGSLRTGVGFARNIRLMGVSLLDTDVTWSALSYNLTRHTELSRGARGAIA